jgi:copper chaperone NosL
MAYQPPLIGFKQLLNFGAYSMPDTGGWMFVAAGALLLACVIIDKRNKKNETKTVMKSVVVTILFVFFTSCTVEKDPIIVGKDNCDYCKMTISDARFGAEIVTKKGKIFKYDEGQCLLSDIEEGAVKEEDVKDIYLTDFCQKHELINQENALLLKSEEFKSPMGGNVAAFSVKDSMIHYKNTLNAEEVNWSSLSK